MPDVNPAPSTEIGDDDWYELLAWVKASERRVEILRTLAEGPKNANDFADSWEVTLEAVRYHMTQLQEGGPINNGSPLVRVLTPDRRRYRLYGLTELGRQTTEFL